MVQNELAKMWDVVNCCNTISDISKAEKVLRKSNISVADFDEMMSALSWLSVDIYRNRRKG